MVSRGEQFRNLQDIYHFKSALFTFVLYFYVLISFSGSFFFFLTCLRPLISQLPSPLVAHDSCILVFLCCVFMYLQHCSKSASTSWMWLLRSSVIIANKPWPRITLTMTTTALILIMAVFNMVSFYVTAVRERITPIRDSLIIKCNTLREHSLVCNCSVSRK